MWEEGKGRDGFGGCVLLEDTRVGGAADVSLGKRGGMGIWTRIRRPCWWSWVLGVDGR